MGEQIGKGSCSPCTVISGNYCFGSLLFNLFDFLEWLENPPLYHKLLNWIARAAVHVIFSLLSYLPVSRIVLHRQQFNFGRFCFLNISFLVYLVGCISLGWGGSMMVVILLWRFCALTFTGLNTFYRAIFFVIKSRKFEWFNRLWTFALSHSTPS